MSAATQTTPRRVYSISEAAECLRVHPDTIRRAIERGDLSASRKLGVWRIPASAIAEAAGETERPLRKGARR